MDNMAIVKATYTKSSGGAKAGVRYIEHRPGKDGEKMNRTLFNGDGAMGRWQAYQMIDEADKGSFFFRLVISPDPKQEDTGKDLFLREITQQMMLSLEDRLHKQVQWVAVEHDDHAPHRHVHIVAIVPERLQIQDLQSLRLEATAACLEQRHQRDLAREQQDRKREGEQWEREL